LVTADGNLSLSFSTRVMRYFLNIFMIYANGTFCITLKNTRIAALFIDMHSAIDMLNFKCGNVANTCGTRGKYAVLQCSVRQCNFLE